MIGFVKISDCEEVNRLGFVRALVRGHGVFPGKMRMPLDIGGRYYYRVTSGGKTSLVRASDIVSKAFGKSETKFDETWYREVRFLVFQYNLMRKINHSLTYRRKRHGRDKEAARIRAEQTTDAQIQDDFSNDRWAG
jgi:hypothetical protein